MTFSDRVPQRYIDLMEQYHKAVAARDWQTCDTLAAQLTDDLGPNWLHREFAADGDPA